MWPQFSSSEQQQLDSQWTLIVLIKYRFTPLSVYIFRFIHGCYCVVDDIRLGVKLSSAFTNWPFQWESAYIFLRDNKLDSWKRQYVMLTLRQVSLKNHKPIKAFHFGRTIWTYECEQLWLVDGHVNRGGASPALHRICARIFAICPRLKTVRATQTETSRRLPSKQNYIWSETSVIRSYLSR